MNATKTYSEMREVRAVYHGGVLKLLDALDLPERTQVRVSIQSVLPETTDQPSDAELVYDAPRLGQQVGCPDRPGPGGRRRLGRQ